MVAYRGSHYTLGLIDMLPSGHIYQLGVGIADVAAPQRQIPSADRMKSLEIIIIPALLRRPCM